VPHFLATSGSCAFHTLDGVAAESEGVRFIRLREDAQVGKEILRLQAYPRSTAALKGADASGDHKYFNLTEHNATTLVISLARSLERLVDRDVPRNLLKFRILCAGKHEKLEEVSCPFHASPGLWKLNFTRFFKNRKNIILISFKCKYVSHNNIKY